jgi:hypothetical protein
MKPAFQEAPPQQSVDGSVGMLVEKAKGVII